MSVHPLLMYKNYSIHAASIQTSTGSKMQITVKKGGILKSGKKRLLLRMQLDLQKKAFFCIFQNIRFFVMYFRRDDCSSFFCFFIFYTNLAAYVRQYHLEKMPTFSAFSMSILLIIISNKIVIFSSTNVKNIKLI